MNARLATLLLLTSALTACGGESRNSNSSGATNNAPTVSAGIDQTVVSDTTVQLTATASDIDGDALSYSWAQTSGTNITLSAANIEDPSFTAPSADTVIVLTLTVSDGTASTSDSISITVEAETTTGGNRLVINEIVAKDANDGNDWIELLAVGGDIDLSAYTIVDDDTSHAAEALPARTLASGEYLVLDAIDADDTPPTDTDYVTFKLGSEDTLTLFKDGIATDTLGWLDGEAPSGNSYGLLPDGTGAAQTLTPTKGAENEAGTVTAARDVVTNNDAELRINEIVAKDADGGYDWIEFYVTGDNSVSLGDYTIADKGSELLVLPSVTLSPGSYYRIAATDDDVTGIERVDFKLGGDDSVSLFKGDDLIDELSWNDGDALINYSYGRLPDGSDRTVALSPSPDSPNSSTVRAQLIINEIVKKDASGGDDWFELYNNSTENIDLSEYSVIDESDDIDPAPLPDVILQPGEYIVIFATDTDPATHFVPFKLGGNDELSLIKDDETVDYVNWEDSDGPEGFSYGVSPSDMWTFDTLTPTQGAQNADVLVFDTTVVESVYINIEPAELQDIFDNAIDEEYHPASVIYKGVELEEVAIRTKGNSSLNAVASDPNSDRYSFKIDINEYVDDQKLLNLKKFTLHNNFKDPSYMREYLSYKYMNQMGLPTPRNSYVNLYFNNELHGLYLMVEAIDGEFLEDNFENPEGDLYKPDGVGSDLVWVDDNITSYSDANLDSNEDTSDNGAFINFLDALNNGDSASVTDVDSVLRYMSVSTALSNMDSYQGALVHNYYIYEQDGVFSVLPWDLNESFGTFRRDCGNADDLRNLTIDEPTSGALNDRPLIAKLFASQTNLDTYHGYLQTLIDGPLSSATFEAEVNAVSALIRDDVAADPTAFYSVSEFDASLTTDTNAVYGLTRFVNQRSENIQNQLNGALARSGDGSGFCTGGGGPGGGG